MNVLNKPHIKVYQHTIYLHFGFRFTHILQYFITQFRTSLANKPSSIDTITQTHTHTHTYIYIYINIYI